MDVNGTCFHLIKGHEDWCRCRLDGQPAGVSDWCHDPTAPLSWGERSATVSLSPLLTLFPRGEREQPLNRSSRRGAAFDQYGNVYWIGADRRTLYWIPAGRRRAHMFWDQSTRACRAGLYAFQPDEPPGSPQDELAGLAVTEHHYLVVGNVSRRGLFVFDLHIGGEPTLMLFPDETPFEPFDMAAAPHAGLWVLDRVHRNYWGFDRAFRVYSQPGGLEVADAELPTFRPEAGLPVVCPSRQFPNGFALDETADPISIESLPDGSVIVLDTPLSSPLQASVLHHYRLDQRISAPLPLETLVDLADDQTDPILLSIIGYDMLYTPHDETLYVTQQDGNQAVAYQLALAGSPPTLELSRGYYPMQSFGGRSLVVRDSEVYYDLARGESNDERVRWVRLHEIPNIRYATAATLLTWQLDGKQRDCVWHRLLLDACIPSETRVQVWSRASDDPELLEDEPFMPEPLPYLRTKGSEIPYYDAFAGLDQPPDGVGTWELLFQSARGRHLQLKLVLSGNGRVTPELKALRAYYPRFSYPQRYLPAVYSSDAESGSFLERLLANMEGLLTEIDGKIEHADSLFDPRSAPPETLDWLARWIGLALDPLWAELQRRRRSAGRADIHPTADRRRLFIRFAHRLYEQRGTVDGIRFALHLLLDAGLEAKLDRFKSAAVREDAGLLDELRFIRTELTQRVAVPYPTAATSEAELEDLLQEFLLSRRRPTKIRLVERFRARAGRALVEGDPTQLDGESAAADDVAGVAHRFTVLVPEDLSAVEEAMVRRVVDLEKPAHTDFDVRRYWDFFRVGEVRLGLDTTLGEASRFVPTLLGRDYLGEGFLPPAHPMDQAARLISDRDRIGDLPPL